MFHTPAHKQTSPAAAPAQRSIRQYRTKSVPQLVAGDVVSYYGGEFVVTTNAQSVLSSRSDYADGWKAPEFVGASTCAVAKGRCISGEVPGYFKPGSEWTFQGNFRATHAVR